MGDNQNWSVTNGERDSGKEPNEAPTDGELNKHQQHFELESITVSQDAQVGPEL